MPEIDRGTIAAAVPIVELSADSQTLLERAALAATVFVGLAAAGALLAALLIFRLLPRGFTNRDLRQLTAELRGLPAISAGQITYDLRRLRSHHLIERIPGTHRYRVTGTGLHTAMILTRLHDRVLPAALAQLTETIHPPGKLRAAATATASSAASRSIASSQCRSRAPSSRSRLRPRKARSN